jgi:hypothetical protein
MQLTQENDLINSLQLMINSYMSRNPQLTLNALAQRSNIPITSLRRLVGGGQKSEIAPHSVLNLVSYILRERNISKLIAKLDLSIASFLKRHFGNFIFVSETKNNECDFELELRDQTKFLIFKMAQNHNGVELETLTENFGILGTKKIEEMISDGLLISEGQRLHAVDKNYQVDSQLVADHLPALVQFYKPELAKEGMNYFVQLNESLNPEAIEKITEIQRRSLTEIQSIISNVESLGEIPYFYLNLSETMILDPLQKEYH